MAITAGADLGFLSYRSFRPSLELRGTYPFYKGRIDDQRDFLGGVKIERQYGAFHPYADFLIGRGSINYANNGFFYKGLFYVKTVSTVYSPGLGLDYDVTEHWAAKLDFQYQHWDAPVVPSGVINPKVFSAGAVYRFDFNHRYKRARASR